jgi:hypothetical protein
MNIFNGKKIININYNNLEDAKFVIEQYFYHHNDIEWILTPNNEHIFNESYIFINKLLPKINSLNDHEITFMAHAKGVTRYRYQHDFPLFLWIHTLYQQNLTNPKKICSILKNYSCCGTLKINNITYFPDNIGNVPWHYSGAFFWFNNKKLFSNPNWSIPITSRYILEVYLSNFFDTEEAFGIEPHMVGDTHNIHNWENTYTGKQI